MSIQVTLNDNNGNNDTLIRSLWMKSEEIWKNKRLGNPYGQIIKYFTDSPRFVIFMY